MIRRLYVSVVLGWLCLTVSQAQTIEDVLRSVERNNKELSAQRKSCEAEKVGIDAENVLDDTSVEYISQYNKEVAGQSTSELVVSQGFDFPTLYGARSREGRERKTAVDYRSEALRRRVLLDARQLCLDLVYLNRLGDVLRTRQRNADELLAMYEERLKAGDVTQIEVNKIKMERMTIQTEVLRNNAARRTTLHSLQILNGNVPLEFAGKDYPAVAVPNNREVLLAEVIGNEAEIHAASAELRAAERAVTVNRQKWLPHLEVGYRRNTAVDSPKEHGFIIGGSLPLFSNSRQVKMARLQSEEARMTLDDVRLKTEAEAHSLFNELQQLRGAMEIYDMSLMVQTIDLLKAGVDKGEISVVEYFTEADQIYQNMQAYMEIEKDYHKTVASLYKNKL